MDILLTGASGFIGSNFHQHYKDRYNIICIDKLEGQDLLTCNLPSVDLVIHLAGLSGVRQSFENPTDYWKQNVIVSQRLFDCYKNTRVMYASSSTAYEPWRNPYALSKHAVEQIAPRYSLGMRFTTTYGPNAREQMLIPKILRNDVQWVNTNHKRDFIHVDDLINAFIQVIKSKSVNKIYNLGSGKRTSINTIAKIFGGKKKFIPIRPGEPKNSVANIKKVKKEINWKPKISIEQGIKKLLSN